MDNESPNKTDGDGTQADRGAADLPPFEEWPSGVLALASIGPASKRLMAETVRCGSPLPFNEQDAQSLAHELIRNFSDERAADVITRLLQDVDTSVASMQQILNWLRVHAGDPKAVVACMSVRPPEGLKIRQLLSTAGSQKLVFVADWPLQQRDVVLKRLLGPLEQQAKILKREAQAHPLSLRHDNIIETYVLQNDRGEKFLVERKLTDVLHDGRLLTGTEEAANLLVEIGGALSYLHEESLVHGDVKPDNIGILDGRFVLLDFGIARQIDDFTPESTPTGSLRTRAPELLLGAGAIDPIKADVWALAATLFNGLVGRFPLFRTDDGPPPRVWEPDRRADFEAELARRAAQQYHHFVTVSELDEPLRQILAKALEANPDERIDAQALLEHAGQALQAYLRRPPAVGGLSLLQELDLILDQVFPATVRAMPAGRRQALLSRLIHLQRLPEAQSREPKLGRLITSFEETLDHPNIVGTPSGGA